MTKARKVRLARRAATAKPRISHRKGKARKPEPKAKPAERATPAEGPKRGMNARLAAMVAASAELEEVPEPQKAKAPPAGSELAKLTAEPLGALKAFVEDANTVTRALQGKQGAKAVEQGAADTLYHLLVACRQKGVGLEKVVTELFARHIAEELQRKST
jgi:phosphoribosyl-ATP pyrophosphohydrolase